MTASPVSGNQPLEVPSVADLIPPWKICDRVHKYVIEERKLFGRFLAKEGDPEWSQIFLPDGRIPTQVKADWENLMVLDSAGDVHYTKSMRGEESLIDNLPWQRGIWNLPVLGPIYNCIARNPNFVVANGEAWDCSYLEGGCHYIDGKNNLHPLGDEVGMIGATTTAYVADQEHRYFRYYDPYIPPWVGDRGTINIPFPETSKSIFDLRGFASCRSQLLLVGYDRIADDLGVKNSLALYTISADANLRGLNPEISYTYSMQDGNKKSFVLPASHYQKLPIPEGRISSVVGVERAMGDLMTNVVFTIEGELDGVAGFFYLSPGEDQWQFQELETHHIDPEAYLESEYIEEDGVFSSFLRDWVGRVFETEYTATLKDFGTRAMESYIDVEVGEEVYQIPLYIKESQLNLIGFNWTKDTLVIPQAVREAFGWDIGEVVSVLCEEEEGQILIKTKDDHQILFCFGSRDVVDSEGVRCQI